MSSAQSTTGDAALRCRARTWLSLVYAVISLVPQLLQGDAAIVVTALFRRRKRQLRQIAAVGRRLRNASYATGHGVVQAGGLPGGAPADGLHRSICGCMLILTCARQAMDLTELRERLLAGDESALPEADACAIELERMAATGHLLAQQVLDALGQAREFLPLLERLSAANADENDRAAATAQATEEDCEQRLIALAKASPRSRLAFLVLWTAARIKVEGTLWGKYGPKGTNPADHEEFKEVVEAVLDGRYRYKAQTGQVRLESAFISAWTGLPGFGGTSRFSTWVTTIALRRCLDELEQRKQDKDRFMSIDDEDDPGACAIASESCDPGEGLIECERLERIRDVVLKLSALLNKDEVIALERVSRGEDYKTIARALARSYSAVNSLIERARAKVKKHFWREVLKGSEKPSVQGTLDFHFRDYSESGIAQLLGPGEQDIHERLNKMQHEIYIAASLCPAIRPQDLALYEWFFLGKHQRKDVDETTLEALGFDEQHAHEELNRVEEALCWLLTHG